MSEQVGFIENMRRVFRIVPVSGEQPVPNTLHTVGMWCIIGSGIFLLIAILHALQ